MNKFKIGDKVKRINGAWGGMKVDDVGTVVEVINRSFSQDIILAEHSGSHSANNFVLVYDNKMPELEAGKHVVLMNYSSTDSHYYLVLAKADGELFGKQIDDDEYWASKFGGNILEIHTLPSDGCRVFKPSAYNESTLIWKRDDKKDKLREEYEQLQKQIAELQAKANDIGKLI